MSSALAILIPVLDRPHRVEPVLANIRETTPDARVLFLADKDDLPEHAAILAAGADVLIVDGTYAHKINVGCRATKEPLVFTGADDLTFTAGWFEAAAAAVTGGVQVVGVNDDLKRRRERHATHFLLAREYAAEPCIDGSQGPMFEGYDHSFIDDELIATATSRGVYAYEGSAVVAHQHWMNGRAPDDEVYRKGRARFRIDRRLFIRRSRLWT